MSDKINPSHYQSSEIQANQITSTLDFNTGNAVKYIWRWGNKEGESLLDDLRKAHWYLTNRNKENDFRKCSYVKDRLISKLLHGLYIGDGYRNDDKVICFIQISYLISETASTAEKELAYSNLISKLNDVISDLETEGDTE